MTFTLAAMSTVAVVRYAPDAVLRGAEHRTYARRINATIAIPPNESRWVAWLGDSTIRPRPDLRLSSYPLEVGARLADGTTGNWFIALPALDSFHYFYLLAPVLELKPDVLVLTATFRSFHGVEVGQERNYLCSFMQPELISSAITLPFYARGMTIPDLFFCPFLKHPPIQRAILFLDGIRRMFIESPVWGDADYAHKSPTVTEAAQTVTNRLTAWYGPAVTRATPALVVLGEVVRTASAHGIETIVVLSANPIELLEQTGLYDEALFASRVATVESIVHEAGGTLVDINDVIPASEMRDGAGHLNHAGIAHVTDILVPVVREALNAAERSR
jgi:hypothetical protein